MKGYVLITGATSGIGYALAKVFAKEKYPLLLVGRNEDKLEYVKQELAAHTIVETTVADLSQREAAFIIYEEAKERKLDVEILINNAGAGKVAAFCEYDVKVDVELMELNMVSVTLLTKFFAQDMKKKGRGRILNVASTGSYHPGPYVALYYATKAYILSLSEALYAELRPYGVTVSALCPGATATGFAKAAGRENAGFAMSAEFVAKKAYQGLMKGRKTIIPGLRNKLFVKLPRKVGAYFIEGYQKKLMNK